MTNVREYFGHKAVKGEVGIEIEMEGHQFPLNVGTLWKGVPDGSLRGDENIEYVLNKPVARDKVEDALSILKKKLKANGTIVDNKSPRTSVHVHINVQELTFTQVVNFAVLYMIMEELMVKFCGPHREGNLFCLRVKDAEGLLNILENAIVRDAWNDVGGNIVRYASLNLGALSKYGSLEFRAMRGSDDPELILTWVNMLLHIKDMAMQYDKASDIVSNFSMMGEERWLEATMGGYANLLHHPNAELILHQGVQRIQDIAYATKRKVKGRKPRADKVVPKGYVKRKGIQWADVGAGVLQPAEVRLDAARVRQQYADMVMAAPNPVAVVDDPEDDEFEEDF